MARKERMIPEFKINESGVVIKDTLYVLSEKSWKQNQAKYLDKISCLLEVLRPKNFTKVFVDILWNEKMKKIIIKADSSEHLWEGAYTEI